MAKKQLILTFEDQDKIFRMSLHALITGMRYRIRLSNGDHYIINIKKDKEGQA